MTLLSISLQVERRQSLACELIFVWITLIMLVMLYHICYVTDFRWLNKLVELYTFLCFFKTNSYTDGKRNQLQQDDS